MTDKTRSPGAWAHDRRPRRLGNQPKIQQATSAPPKIRMTKTRAIRQTPAILTSGSNKFRLDRVEVLLGSARTMRLRARCDTIRVGVVGWWSFCYVYSLKSHKSKRSFPHLCKHSCHNAKVVHPSRPIHPSKNLPGTQITVPRLKSP